MVLEAVFHRKRFRERLAVAGNQPVCVVLNRLPLDIVFLIVVGRNEITQAAHHEIRRQGRQITDRRVLDPASFPVVIRTGVNHFIFLGHAVGEQLLYALMLGERYVRPFSFS